uniref:Uncharacterized protein n=1 Tax=Anguilla anguilla TaxID=7936 RepID=A0A0E9SMQ4_ANGAN
MLMKTVMLSKIVHFNNRVFPIQIVF